MFCNSCGSKLKKDDRVCSACGAPADQGETCGGFWGIVTAAPPAAAVSGTAAAAAGGIKQPGTGIKQPANAPAIKEQPRHPAPAPTPAPASAPVHVPAAAPAHAPAPVPVTAPSPKVPLVLMYGLAALLVLLLVGQLVWTGLLHARLNRLADEVEHLREQLGQVEATEPRQNVIPETTTPETTVPETTEPDADEDPQGEKEAVKSDENRPGKPESTEGDTQPSGGDQVVGDTQPSGEDQSSEKPQDEPPAETTN